MRKKTGDAARLQHIRHAIIEILSYTQDTAFDQFASNSMMKYAVIKQLEIIGEAANHISVNLKEKYPKIVWREIVGLRNILIHEYFGVDEKIVWGIITKDIPKLKDQIEVILNEVQQVNDDSSKA